MKIISVPIRVPRSFLKAVNLAVAQVNSQSENRGLSSDRLLFFQQLEKRIPETVRAMTGKPKRKRKPKPAPVAETETGEKT